MIRIALSVEGQTENEFCKKVLTPFFRTCNIEMTPIIITTSKDRCGRKHKGGCISIDRVKSEIQKLLSSYDYVTTLYDFYGFNDRQTNNIEELEQILFDLFNNQKFIPYIQKYEFETLIFSKPEYFRDYFGSDKVTNAMQKIVDSYGDIELINDSLETAPHKRLEKLFQLENEQYDKVFHGEGIAFDIGLQEIRNSAKRFNNWVERILGLNNND
jgi:hypothetical protein